MNSLTKGVLIGAGVIGAVLLLRGDGAPEEPQSAEAWDEYLFSSPDAEMKQYLFWLMASLYGRGSSEQAPTAARIHSALKTGNDPETVRALGAALGRPVAPTEADVTAFTRLPALPASRTRALPFFVTNRLIARMREINDQIRGL